MKYSIIFFLTFCCFSAAFAQKDDSGLSYIIKAEQLKTANNLEGAIGAYDQAIKADPNNYQYVVLKAKIYLQMKGKQEEAIQTLEKVVSLKPDLVEAHEQLAKLHMAKNKMPEAVKSFDNAYKYDNDSKNKFRFKMNIIKICLKSKMLTDIGKHIANAKEIAPDDLTVLYYDAKYHNSINKYDVAKTSMLKATQILQTQQTAGGTANLDVRQQAKFYFELGLAHYKLDEFQKAEVAFEKANHGPFKARIMRMSPLYYMNLAVAYFRVYEMDKSKQMIDIALKMQPNMSAAHELLVKIAATKTDQTPLITQLKLALDAERNPMKRGGKLADMAEHEFEAGHYPEAIASAEECLKIQANNYAMFFIKAISLQRLGKGEDAIKLLEELANSPQLDPESKAQYNFAEGLIYAKSANVKMAITSFKKAQYKNFKHAAFEEVQLLKKGAKEKEEEKEEEEEEEKE
ncbi:MAG: hypothetical protein EAZ97_10230 [Bacteroidetes bacterium]|nr:MAG: hypothetical protein EAZ97_10230 [Bacteroidota bacterium]